MGLILRSDHQSLRMYDNTPDLEDELCLGWRGVQLLHDAHQFGEATPAAAAGLTDHTWSVEKLLRLRLPRQAYSTP